VIPTATTVSVDAGTVINASATGTGNGGKVVLWSNQQTTFAGTILARGGPSGGNGGFVETSSHQLLDFRAPSTCGLPWEAWGHCCSIRLIFTSSRTLGGSPAGASEMTKCRAGRTSLRSVMSRSRPARPPIPLGQNGDIFVNAGVNWTAQPHSQ